MIKYARLDTLCFMFTLSTVLFILAGVPTLLWLFADYPVHLERTVPLFLGALFVMSKTAVEIHRRYKETRDE